LLKPILKFTNHTKWRFASYVIIFTLPPFCRITPVFAQQTVDAFIATEDQKKACFVCNLMGIVLLLESFSQFYFVFWANWFWHCKRDSKIKLFQHPEFQNEIF
jgi:hypothetical protein